MTCTSCGKKGVRSPHRCCLRCGDGVWCADCFGCRLVGFHGLCDECIEQDNEEQDRAADLAAPTPEGE